MGAPQVRDLFDIPIRDAPLSRKARTLGHTGTNHLIAQLV